MRNEGTLIKTINNAINLLSMEGTISALEREMEKKYVDESVCFILSTVTSHLEISVEKLSCPSIRDDHRKIAIGLCGYYLWKEFDYSYALISQKLPFKLSEKTIWQYSQIIQKAKLTNPKSEMDRYIAIHFFTIDNLIKTHKKIKNNYHGTNQKEQQPEIVRAN